MSLRCTTPCDYGDCPYDACYNRDCEAWCGEYEPQDDPEFWIEDEDEGYADIHIGFSDDDCVSAEAYFPWISTDFEIDYFLKKVLPVETYNGFIAGSIVITGIGEDGILEPRERHKSISDFIHGEIDVTIKLGIER